MTDIQKIKIGLLSILWIIFLILLSRYIIIYLSDKRKYLVKEYRTEYETEKYFPPWCRNYICMKVKYVKKYIYDPQYKTKQEMLDWILWWMIMLIISFLIILFI